MWLIIVGDERYQAVELTTDGPHPSEPVALADLALTGTGPVLIALASELCLSAQMTVPAPRFARKAQAMLYKLEEHVPWAAEDYVADWILQGRQAFTVATPHAPLKPLVTKLEADGFAVRSITPLALLAAAGQTVSTRCGDDLFVIEDGALRQWYWSADDLAEWELTRGNSLEIEEVPLLETAAATAARILRDQEEPLIELRRGELAGDGQRAALRGHRFAVEAAACLLLVVVACALVWRGRAYAGWTETLAERQRQVFTEVFPGERVPIGILKRLSSEAHRLEGITGRNEELRETLPAMLVLHRLLAALPADLRYTILEVRIEDGTLHLVGELRSHADAAVVAEALRGQGLDVPPPSTLRLTDSAVEFHLSADWRKT